MDIQILAFTLEQLYPPRYGERVWIIDDNGNRCSCSYRKLCPAVLVMQTTEHRLRNDRAEPLDRPTAWPVFAQG
jgi:hypothetical protein